MLTKSEQAVYNALSLYADDEGEIYQNIKLDKLGEIAGVGKMDKRGPARSVLINLENKGYIKVRHHKGSELKEITILK